MTCTPEWEALFGRGFARERGRLRDSLIDLLVKANLDAGLSQESAQVKADQTVRQLGRRVLQCRADKLRWWRYAQSTVTDGLLDARPLVRLERGRAGTEFSPIERRSIELLEGRRPKARKNIVEREAIEFAKRVAVNWMPKPNRGRPAGAKGRLENDIRLQDVPLTVRETVEAVAPLLIDLAGGRLIVGKRSPAYEAVLTAVLLYGPQKASSESVSREIRRYCLHHPSRGESGAAANKPSDFTFISDGHFD